MESIREPALQQPYIHLEDVFLTGVVAEIVGVEKRHNQEFRNNANRIPARFLSCTLFSLLKTVTIHKVNNISWRLHWKHSNNCYFRCDQRNKKNWNKSLWIRVVERSLLVILRSARYHQKSGRPLTLALSRRRNTLETCPNNEPLFYKIKAAIKNLIVSHSCGCLSCYYRPRHPCFHEVWGSCRTKLTLMPTSQTDFVQVTWHLANTGVVLIVIILFSMPK